MEGGKMKRAVTAVYVALFAFGATSIDGSLIKMDPGVNLNANTFGVINSRAMRGSCSLR
jgi:hypothetical protein